MAASMSRAALFAELRPIFGGQLSQPQVDGINVILASWEQHGDGKTRHLAYILATVKHETADTMQPVRETLARTDAKAKEILTRAWEAGKLPWVERDYWSGGYFGRGFVQLTHRSNYQRAGKALGIDLAGNPSLALDPKISAAILVRGMLEGWFTGQRLADYPNDFVKARRVVNGTDRATLIAGYANRILDAIEKASQAAPQPQERPSPLPSPKPPLGSPDASERKSHGVIGALIAICLVIAGTIMAVWGWLVILIERIF